MQEHEGKGPFLAHSGCMGAATAVLAALRKDGTLPGILQELCAATGKHPAAAESAEEPQPSVSGDPQVPQGLSYG